MGDILKTGNLSYVQKKVLKSPWNKKFFALLTKTKQGICLVGFKNEAVFQRFEMEKRSKPHDVSHCEKLIKTHAQVVIPNIQCLNGVTLKGQDAMETMTDAGKKYLLLADQEGNNCIQSWIITYQFASSQNALASLGSVRGSGDRFLNVVPAENENDLYQSPDEGTTFSVIIIESEASNRLGLQGTFNIQVNSRSLTLIDQGTAKKLFVWPLKYLRRYGRTSSEFSFEAGRRCESGEGVFKFCTLKGNEIFSIVEGMAAAIRERERGGSFHSAGPRTPPPVWSGPRPSSLKKEPLAKSKSFDSGVIDAMDELYAAPIKSITKKMDKMTVAKQVSNDDTPSGNAPAGNYYNIASMYATVGEDAPETTSGKDDPVTDETYENVEAGPARGPAVPPKLYESSQDTVTASVDAKTEVDKNDDASDEPDYADPDDLDEVTYAYASAEDIKRNLPWMKKPEPGAVKFQIEVTDYEYGDYNYM